jgi:hypothetical protein
LDAREMTVPKDPVLRGLLLMLILIFLSVTYVVVEPFIFILTGWTGFVWDYNLEYHRK